MDKKPLILIIDDEADLRDIIKMKLETKGFEVKAAESEIDGINLAREFKPDIILLDLVMPLMNGVEVLAKIKEDPQTKNIKVFLFTGKGDPRPDILEASKKLAIERGAIDFIRKEIDLDELVIRLKRAIEEAKSKES